MGCHPQDHHLYSIHTDVLGDSPKEYFCIVDDSDAPEMTPDNMEVWFYWATWAIEQSYDDIPGIDVQYLGECGDLSDHDTDRTVMFVWMMDDTFSWSRPLGERYERVCNHGRCHDHYKQYKIVFDSDDLADRKKRLHVINHEVGHVYGLGEAHRGEPKETAWSPGCRTWEYVSWEQYPGAGGIPWDVSDPPDGEPDGVLVNTPVISIIHNKGWGPDWLGHCHEDALENYDGPTFFDLRTIYVILTDSWILRWYENEN